jgi:hypothetical protein
MQTTLNNHVCVRVTTDPEGRKFMDVTAPRYASISVHSNGVVHVNINESCVFRLCRAGELHVEVNGMDLSSQFATVGGTVRAADSAIVQ